LKKRVVVIGGGAAGFFLAVNLAEKIPGAEIVIAEKTQKLLSKVKVSGGRRCNVTHDCLDVAELIKNYPRGQKELRNVFSRFAVKETIEWFEGRGVELKTEADGRMFPVTDSSQTIIDCLTGSAERAGVKVWTGCEIKKITCSENKFALETNGQVIEADYIAVTCGGFPKESGYGILSATGHKIVSPIPSLFTLNLRKDRITELMGVSVKYAEVKIGGEKLNYRGPVLITHWGFSGPAVLKLSAFAAEVFHRKNYTAQILLNWSGKEKEDEVKEEIEGVIASQGKVLPAKTPLFDLPNRLWIFLLDKSGIDFKKNWSEQNRKALNSLAANLFADAHNMEGKTTFKEEFVTCGGIDLKQLNMQTMESKIVPGIFFAGEVLNIDGITGGFNFQSAWSTAYLAATAIAGRLDH
jgi:predicted Rossmann fold flavoprotein